MRKLLLLTAAALVGSLVVMPTANAQTECAVDVWAWSAGYDCRVAGVGGAGYVVWCPDALTCVGTHVIGCYVYLGLPWYCW